MTIVNTETCPEVCPDGERRRFVSDQDRLRSTGGNRFIEKDATRGDLLKSINDQLGDLHEWAEGDGRVLDLGEITISTQRISNGKISVTVSADLKGKDD